MPFTEMMNFIFSIDLGLSGLLVTASSFLLGLYLTELKRPTSNSPLEAYRILILAQMIAVLLLYPLSLSFIWSDLGYSQFAASILLLISLPLIPVFAILYLLFRNWKVS